MSLATRCTSCGTAFRVVQDQLKVSEGWVRCGRCDAVFSALEGLFDLGRDAPSDWQAPAVGPAAAAAAAVPAAPSSPARAPVKAHGDTVDISVGSDEGRDDDDEAASSNLGELLADPIDARLFGPRKRAESAPKPASQLNAHERVEFSDARFDSDLFSENTSVPDTELIALPTTLAEPMPLEDPARPEFLRRADRHARWQSMPVRLALGLGCGLAALVLVVQGANLHRDTLAARWPSLRPALLAWCRVAQCRIEAPRRLHEIRLETTSLKRSPGQDSYLLSATLRNQSDLVVLMPWIELKLTDRDDRVVARRVLTPRELRATEVIEPHADTSLQTLLDTGGAPVEGYDATIFYP